MTITCLSSRAGNSDYILNLKSLVTRCQTIYIFQVPPTAKNLPSEFIWGPENEALQMDKCVAWLSSIISIPKGKQVLSVAGQNDLLNRTIESYSLKGTTDLVFIQDHFAKCFNIRGGLEMAVKLKKRGFKTSC